MVECLHFYFFEIWCWVKMIKNFVYHNYQEVKKYQFYQIQADIE